MKITQNNKLKMMQATDSFLKETPPGIITKRPVINILTGKLTNLVEAVIDADEKQNTVAGGAGAEKRFKRTLLYINVASIGRNLISFGTSVSDAQLVDVITKDMFQLSQVNDNRFVQKCRDIHAKAEANLADLGPFGITGALLNSLKVQTEDYSVMAEEFRNKVSVQMDSTKLIAELMKEATRLLRMEIDPVIYSLTDEGSYVAQYRFNREILDLGHRYTQFKGVSVNKETGLELSNVEIEIISSDGELKLKTDIEGKYRIRLHADIYTLRAIHPDYLPFVIDNVKLQPGEIKVENFELVPKP